VCECVCGCVCVCAISRLTWPGRDATPPCRMDEPYLLNRVRQRQYARDEMKDHRMGRLDDFVCAKGLFFTLFNQLHCAVHRLKHSVCVKPKGHVGWGGGSNAPRNRLAASKACGRVLCKRCTWVQANFDNISDGGVRGEMKSVSARRALVCAPSRCEQRGSGGIRRNCGANPSPGRVPRVPSVPATASKNRECMN
jgi:hypothetical protein